MIRQEDFFLDKSGEARASVSYTVWVWNEIEHLGIIRELYVFFLKVEHLEFNREMTKIFAASVGLSTTSFVNNVSLMFDAYNLALLKFRH